MKEDRRIAAFRCTGLELANAGSTCGVLLADGQGGTCENYRQLELFRTGSKPVFSRIVEAICVEHPKSHDIYPADPSYRCS